MPTWINLGCGPFRAPAPWVNLDVIENETTHPDLVVDPLRPFDSFPRSTAHRIYLGHVLEHVPWPAVPDLLAQVRATLAPGGLVGVVGPDVLRTVERYRQGVDDWALVRAVLEDEHHYQHLDGATDDWPEARHWWNCYEERVVRILEAAGFEQVTPQPITPEALADWPVVAHTLHQCAVTAVAP